MAIARASRPAEIGIAAIVIAVVAMLIVPLPRPLLDVLLTLNIAFAVALLMASVFAEKPTTFASFPTLLVVTTLFRVGLEVSVTRLILADADAGSVVSAFGGSVVAGSLVVGLVVFAVITIVQLIVVARGAERVAEVAARFALDAMPGKQMAIDAELRAGSIDAAKAQQRRSDLERESQLYGAMDGAMRFVKGDAIAAILIVVVNLIGGMNIGIGSKGMTAAQAAQTYSLLSIGEGLLAQIPSLLVAVASGLLVTRVASAGDRPLGDDLGAQLGGSPRALIGAAIVLVGLGLVPGMPMVPFLVLAALAGAAAWRSRGRRLVPHRELGEPGAADASPRITLRLSPALRDRLTTDLPALHATLAAARAEVAAAIPIPPLDIATDPSLKASRNATLAIDSTPVTWLDVGVGVGVSVGDPALHAPEPSSPPPLAHLAPEPADDRSRRRATRRRVDAARRSLVREVVPKVVSLAATATRRHPARDRPRAHPARRSARDPRGARARAQDDRPAGPWSSTCAASSAGRSARDGRRAGSSRSTPSTRMIEDALRTSLDRKGDTTVLALEPAIAQDIVAAVRAAKPQVILTSADVRRHPRALLEPELPDIAVVAAHELSPGTSIQTTGRIEVG